MESTIIRIIGIIIVIPIYMYLRGISPSDLNPFKPEVVYTPKLELIEGTFTLKPKPCLYLMTCESLEERLLKEE